MNECPKHFLGPRNTVANEVKPLTLSSWSVHSDRNDNKQMKEWVCDVLRSCECNEENWSTLMGLGELKCYFQSNKWHASRDKNEVRKLFIQVTWRRSLCTKQSQHVQGTIWPIREVYERPGGYSSMNDRGKKWSQEEVKSVEGFVNHGINKFFFSKCDFKTDIGGSWALDSKKFSHLSLL